MLSQSCALSLSPAGDANAVPRRIAIAPLPLPLPLPRPRPAPSPPTCPSLTLDSLSLVASPLPSPSPSLSLCRIAPLPLTRPRSHPPPLKFYTPTSSRDLKSNCYPGIYVYIYVWVCVCIAHTEVTIDRMTDVLVKKFEMKKFEPDAFSSSEGVSAGGRRVEWRATRSRVANACF